jgi:FolB domain-containing protein
MRMDVVLLRNLRFELAVGSDAWHRRGKPQPVSISLEIGSGVAIQNAAAGDDVSKALDYGKLYKLVHRKLTTSNTNFRDVHALQDAVRNCIASNISVKIEINLPKALLRAEGGLAYSRVEEYKDGYLLPIETLSISGIRCACIIGVNPHERLEKQVVIVSLIFTESSEGAPNSAAAQKVPVDRYQAITTDVVEVRYSSRSLLERLPCFMIFLLSAVPFRLMCANG